MEFIKSLNVSRSQMLRLVGNGLKFCKQRRKHSFSTSKFEIAEDKVQVYRTISRSNLKCF